jgi:very-short-patch-repair endonuclease
MPQRRNRTPLFQERSRGLRRTQNEAEALVWSTLRDRQLHGFKFRRQYPTGNYVLDFYCAEAALAIELDGASHAGREQYDADRQTWLESQGLLVLRFTNEQIRDAFGEFMKTVELKCVERSASRRKINSSAE